MVKRFILNADDFGMSSDTNRAILEGYESGILRSASIVANGECFEDAINSVIPKIPELCIGIHLNITEGKALCSDLKNLTDENGVFNNSFLQILVKSYNKKEPDFLQEVEREFRRQIETILSKTKVTHINSHNQIHAIPKLFDMVCRLAKEYGIKQVRSHYEKFYIVPDVLKHLKLQYFKNVFKASALNMLTIFNEATVHKYGLETNDYLIGNIYSSMMDALAVSYGISAVRYDNITVETIIHPCRYEDGTINNHFDEFLLVKNKKLREKIEKFGFEITNYNEKEE